MKTDFSMIAAAAAALAVMGMAFIPAGALDIPEEKTPAVTEHKEYVQNIGSVSKMFGTVAAMQLYEQGKLDIDRPVADYLPEFTMEDERYKDITVRMLMDHTSGLMGTTFSDSFLYDDSDSTFHDSFISLLSRERLKDEPGEFASYCNDGFTLLEHVVERVSGESFTDYVEKHICAPLGMERTGTPCNMFGTEDHVRVQAAGTDFAADYVMTLASGGILSTSEDLNRFGCAFFTGNETMLSDSSKEEMLISVAKDRFEAAGNSGNGLGWDDVGYDDYEKAGIRVMSKGGATEHQYAALYVAPDEEISISVLVSGGNGNLPSYLASALLDTALEDKGIEVTHEGLPEMSLTETVPVEYLKYEGYYSRGGFLDTDCVIYRLSFHEGKYALLERVDGNIKRDEKYMYTGEGSFVRVKEGSDGYRPDPERSVISFVEKYGRTYIAEDSEYRDMSLDIVMKSSGYIMEKMEPNTVDKAVQAAWDGRQGKYYVCSPKYSNNVYNTNPALKLRTFEELPGYTNMGRMTDSTHAVVYTSIPGGREFTDIEVRERDGREYIFLRESDFEVMSERDMPSLTEDIHEVALEKGRAKWYNIGEMGGKTIVTDIPGNSAVYVYDKSDNVLYSSYMKNYGNKIILPEEGKIVFIGEDGGTVRIN